MPDSSAKPLHRRLGLILLISSVLPVLLLGALALYREQTLSLQQAQAQLRTQARFLAVHLDQFLQHHLTLVVHMAEDLQERPGCRSFDCAASELQRMRESSTGFRGAILVDAEGLVLASSSELGEPFSRMVADGTRRVEDRDYFRVPRDTGQPYVSDVFAGRIAGNRVVAVSAPMYHHGFDGIVQGALNLDEISETLVRALANGSYSLQVIGRDGELIIRHPAIGPLFLPDDEKVRIDLASGWELTLGSRHEMAVQSARRLTVLLVITLIATVLSALLVSRWLARRVSRPLVDLAGAVREADLSSEVEVLQLPSPSGASAELETIVGAVRTLGKRLARANALQHRALAERDQALESRDDYIRAQTAELQQALDTVRVTLRTRDQLVANTSHELRTPVAGLISGLELMRQSALPDDLDRQVTRLQASAEHLLAVLNDLLDFERADAGGLQFKLEPMRLAEEANRVIDGLSELARKKGLQLQVDEGPGSRQLIRGDAERFRQLLYNLLGNALKFSDHGVVRVELSYRDGTVSCIVADNGPGVADADRERIFEPFFQADSSDSRRHGGTGLGLAICRRIVKAFGGQLTLESQAGLGSRFKASWPSSVSREALQVDTPSTDVAPASPAPEEAAVAPVATEQSADLDQRPLQVLVVDDVDLNRELLQAMSESLGASADIADSGEQALLMMAEQHYDLVLLNVQMPRMDGYQTVAEIRRRELANGAWIVAVTASAQPRDAQNCLDAGMDDYRAKPLRLEGLRELLVQVRQRRQPSSAAGA
ncbi:MAG: ATP-binding protein [Lysobacterales bacterium]